MSLSLNVKSAARNVVMVARSVQQAWCNWQAAVEARLEARMAVLTLQPVIWGWLVRKRSAFTSRARLASLGLACACLIGHCGFGQVWQAVSCDGRSIASEQQPVIGPYESLLISLDVALPKFLPLPVNWAAHT